MLETSSEDVIDILSSMDHVTQTSIWQSMVLIKQLLCHVNQMFMPHVLCEHFFTEMCATYEKRHVHHLQMTFHHAPEKSSFYSKPDLGHIQFHLPLMAKQKSQDVSANTLG